MLFECTKEEIAATANAFGIECPEIRRSAIRLAKRIRKIAAKFGDDSFVYFVQCESFVKIGASRTPRGRFSALSMSSPFEMHLLGFVPGTREGEYALHDLFHSEHHKMEWFNLNEQMQLGMALAAYGHEKLQYPGDSYPYFSSSSLKKRPPHWFKHPKKLCDSIGRRSGN